MIAISTLSVILGAVAFSGAGLNSIGNTGSLSMMIAGGAVLLASIMMLRQSEIHEKPKAFQRQKNFTMTVPFNKILLYKPLLTKGEFFTYIEDNGTRNMMVFSLESDIDEPVMLGSSSISLYQQNHFYQEISLSELQIRIQKYTRTRS